MLVNNAGVGQVVPLALMEEADWDRMMNVNVKGAFLVTAGGAARDGPRAAQGRILNVSSLAGVKMMQAPVHYSAAKAALRGFTEALAKEIGRYGITVNCIAPGVLEEGVSGNLPPAQARGVPAQLRARPGRDVRRGGRGGGVHGVRPEQLHERRHLVLDGAV